MIAWREGLPPGDYYVGMENDYEVQFTCIGIVYHRPIVRKDAEMLDSTAALKLVNELIKLYVPHEINQLDLKLAVVRLIVAIKPEENVNGR